MNLGNLIVASYGTEDVIFGGHSSDRKKALEALVFANEASVSYDEYIEQHKIYLDGCKDKIKKLGKDPQQHINEQLKRVQDLKNYF